MGALEDSLKTAPSDIPLFNLRSLTSPQRSRWRSEPHINSPAAMKTGGCGSRELLIVTISLNEIEATPGNEDHAPTWSAANACCLHSCNSFNRRCSFGVPEEKRSANGSAQPTLLRQRASTGVERKKVSPRRWQTRIRPTGFDLPWKELLIP